MASKVKCTCGHSWNKSDSSKKDVNVCHVCGKDNTMKNGGWLDNYGEADNANDSDVSLPEDFNGLSYDTTGRDYSPAWGGQFQTGGSLKLSKPTLVDGLMNNFQYFTGIETLPKSPYKPTISKNPNATYYSSPEMKEHVLGNMYSNVKSKNWEDFLKNAESKNRRSMSSLGLGQYRTTKGKDDNGDYISFQDTFDWDMVEQLTPGASPFEVYDRIYEDDFKKIMKKYKTGGDVIPGSQGFTYARTGDIPSNGKYAKKTMASAQNGKEMKFYQEGLDWKPKSMQDGGEAQKTPEQIKIEQEKIKKARETAFKTIQPSNYDDLKNMARWATNTKRETYDDPRSEEFWGNYLKQSKDLKYLRPSEYSPTIAKKKDAKYLSVDDELEQAIFNSFKDSLEPNQIKQANETDIPGKYDSDVLQDFISANPGLGDRNPSGSIARALGNFTVSKGNDEKGDYVSYYDTYDFPDWIQNRVKGEPYEIYGRIYYPEKKKNGGIIKDNQGYWNPENHGKVVEIDSNNITMQGVNQSLLGVSDQGDVQYMEPGKDYKFKGSKVREYPIARLGINDLDAQPMKKLNQLTNFTNNPDKNNWLDKYN